MKGVMQKISSMTKRSSGDGAPAPEHGIVAEHVARLKAAEEHRKAKEAHLTSLTPLVVDTTMVECLSTGHETLEDKLYALQLTRACGLREVVLAAFVKGRTGDLPFLEALHSQKLIDEHCFAFTELFDANGSDLPGQDLPFGLAKMIQYGIQNAILEVDLAAAYINWDKYAVEDFCALVESRCRWVAGNLYAGRTQPPASFVNLRDFSAAMQAAPARVLSLVEFLARLDPAVRPRGLIINDPASGHASFAAVPAVAAVRGVMEAAGWAEGQLLVHVGPGFGLAHATVLECLAGGCGGVMAALCEEADPAAAHASSLLDLVNLARIGNKHVAERFDMDRLRTAAKEVSAIMERAKAAAAAAPLPLLLDGRNSATMKIVEPLSSSPGKPLPHAIPIEQRQPLIPGHA